MNIKKYIFLFFFFLIAFNCCNYKERKTSSSNFVKIDTSFAYRNLIYDPLFDSNCGVKKGDEIQMYLNDTFRSYSSPKCGGWLHQDTVVLRFIIADGYLIFKIFKSTYSTQIEYFTDVTETYPDGGNFGCYLSPKLFYSYLYISAKRQFKTGDTISGHYQVRTNTFSKNEYNGKILKQDLYLGNFLVFLK